MKLPDNFIQQGITEQDVLRLNSNTYQPGFMQIHLTFPYSESFAALTDIHDQGSFLHEYVHYLQNLTTPWGLYTSMLMYETMVNTFAYIQETSETIKLPLRLNFGDKIQQRMSIVSNGNGTNPFENDNCHGSFKIDRTKRIIWHRNYTNIGNGHYPYIELEVPCIDGSKKIKLGAYIIKESMAAMCQMQLDFSAKHEEYDVPYNLIKILAEQHFPKIAADDKKLISICYISLFSLTPAQTLIDQLDFANHNPKYSGMELLEMFVNESTISINNNTKLSVVAFFDDIANRFEVTLAKSLRTPLDYIHEAISRVRLSGGIVPLVSALYAPNFDKDTVQTIIDHVGIPYVYTDFGEYYYPKSVKGENKDSNDIIVLIGMSALYNYIVHPNSLKCCPLRYMCMKSDFDKDECFDAPWEGHACPMTVMGDMLGIKRGQLVW